MFPNRHRLLFTTSRPGSAPAAVGTHPLTAVLAVALWIATVGNWPLWRALLALPDRGTTAGTVAFGAVFALAIAALMVALLAPLAWPRLVKPVLAVVLLNTAFISHFCSTYGVVIDPTMMTNVLQTDAREVRDLLSLRMLASVAIIAGLPMLWLWRRPLARRGAGRHALTLVGAVIAGLLVCVGALALKFGDVSSTMRNHTSLRYLITPVNGWYSLGRALHQSQALPDAPPLPIGLDARIAPRPEGRKPPLMLLVIGETARADHFSLNGYARPTNAELARVPGVVSYPDVTSCGTNTAASLPCMVSLLGREGHLAAEVRHENLLDLVQRAGMAVLWLDNQSGCKGLCERVPNAWAHTPPTSATPLPAGLCTGQECLDAALLHGLDERLAALPAEQRAKGVLLVLHQMGSHGPAYHRRSPPERKPFTPECTSPTLAQCAKADLVNTYDNSIAYTDHVLAQATAWLGRQTAAHEPALLYVSDHGESLGENNVYLHGLPYAVAPRAQTHVPLIAWWPDTPGAPLDRACVAASKATPLSHDHLSHTVVGWLGITASEYRPAFDAWAACRRKG